MVHPYITDRRGRTVHVGSPSYNGMKPLCKPETRVSFHTTLMGGGQHLCASCSSRELRFLGKGL